MLQDAGKFTANVADEVIGRSLRVRKAVGRPEKREEITLNIQHGVENDERHARREQIIRERFPDIDSESYVVVPTAVLGMLGIKPPAGATIASISKIRIRETDGREKEVAIVPSGTSFGLTSKAAEALRIPAELKQIKFYVDRGVLVI